MEAKVAVLETKMGHIDAAVGKVDTRMTKVEDRLVGVETNLSTLSERVAHLPSKGFIVTAVILAGSLFTAISLMLDNIKSLIGG